MKTSPIPEIPYFLKNGIRSTIDAIDALLQHGYQQIGRGKHAVAFAIPHAEYVVVLRLKNDLGWHLFHHFAQNNPSIHYPKSGIVEQISPHLTACSIERLEHREWCEEDANNIIHQVARHYVMHKNTTPQRAENILHHLGSISMANTIKSLSTLVNDSISFDLHEGNIMYRSETPVFIDPLVVHEQDSVQQLPLAA